MTEEAIEEQKRPKPHPLLIDHVIENVLNNGDFIESDYLNFRLVCKEWKIAATSKVKIFLNLYQLLDIHRIEKLLRLLRNHQETVPEIQKIELGKDLIPKNRKASQFQGTLGKLLCFASSQIQTLSLVMHDTTDLRFCDRHYSSMRTFTNLKVLQLTMFNRGPKENDGYGRKVGLESHFFLNLSEKLLKEAPAGLERLEIRWHPPPSHQNGSNFRDQILRNIPVSLHELKIVIFDDLTLQDTIAISSLQLPNLTRLSLDFRYFPEFDFDFSIILNNFKDTLKKLSLTLEPKRRIHLQLPVFPNLTSLKMCLWKVGPAINAQLALGSIFPKVQEISINCPPPSQEGADILEALFPTGFAAPEVTSFTWGCFLRLWGSEIDNLIQGFRSLRKVIIEEYLLVNHDLIFIFKHGGLLEELSIKIGEVSGRKMIRPPDLVLTGISDNYSYNSIQNVPDWKSLELAKVKRYPGLSDLRNLKILKVLGEPVSPLFWKTVLNITDVTGHFGFLQLPKLEKLVTDEFRMSKEFIAELKARFGEDAISRRESTVHMQPFRVHK